MLLFDPAKLGRVSVEPNLQDPGAAAALPAKVPLQLVPGRFVFTFVGVLVAAVLGSAISLRRVTRIDPASAIGTTA